MIPQVVLVGFSLFGFMVFVIVRKNALSNDYSRGICSRQKSSSSGRLTEFGDKGLVKQQHNSGFVTTIQKQLPGGRFELHLHPSDTSVALKPMSLAKPGAIALGIFSTFWYSAIVFFIYDAWKSWTVFGIVSTLFLVPFIVIGIFMLGATIRLAYSLGNPVPVLFLNNDVVEVGGKLRVRWRFEGSLARYRGASFALRAKEETVRGGGGDVVQRSQHTIFEETIGTFLKSDGEFTVGIPANSPPSFETPNNRIVWTIKVLANIEGRPQVCERFRIWVRR